MSFISALFGTTIISYSLVYVYKLVYMIQNVPFCREWRDYSWIGITSLDCFPCPPGAVCRGDNILGCDSSDLIMVEHPFYIHPYLRKLFLPVCVHKAPDSVPLEDHLLTIAPYAVGLLIVLGIYQYYRSKINYAKFIKQLAKQSIQMVRKHAIAVESTDTSISLPTGIDVVHLRDNFLYPKYGLKKRIAIWKDVSAIVTSNSNVSEQKTLFNNEWHLVWSYKSSISDHSDIEE